MKRIYELIKQTRLELGETQLQFSQRFGFKNETACCRWEKGVRPDTIPDAVVDFVFNYKVSTPELIIEQLKKLDCKYWIAWEDKKGCLIFRGTDNPSEWHYKTWLTREAPNIRKELDEKRQFAELQRSLQIGEHPIID